MSLQCSFSKGTLVRYDITNAVLGVFSEPCAVDVPPSLGGGELHGSES
jgi:hypothetical protein